MSINQSLWKISDSIEEIKETKLNSELELENILQTNIEILNDNWLVIGRQVLTVFNKYIDLLAIDINGSIIILELKKDKTPRDVVAQSIDYASWIKNHPIPGTLSMLSLGYGILGTFLGLIVVGPVMSINFSVLMFGFILSMGSLLVIVFNLQISERRVSMTSSIGLVWLIMCLIGVILAVLYAYLYVLLQLEDYALLLGSIGLFVVLGIIMFVTRKINWYAVEGPPPVASG